MSKTMQRRLKSFCLGVFIKAKGNAQGKWPWFFVLSLGLKNLMAGSKPAGVIDRGLL
jgi:hypothetical protein